MGFSEILRLFRFLDSITRTPDLSGLCASCSFPLPIVNTFHFHHPSSPHQSAQWHPLEDLQSTQYIGVGKLSQYQSNLTRDVTPIVGLFLISDLDMWKQSALRDSKGQKHIMLKTRKENTGLVLDVTFVCFSRAMEQLWQPKVTAFPLLFFFIYLYIFISITLFKTNLRSAISRQSKLEALYM